jgi:hypothetical protein
MPRVNRQAFTFTHNRDGEKLRLPERLLLAGAKYVHAIDINDDWLSHGRELAARAGADGVTFSKTLDREKYDIVISLSAMEHFREPGKELARMCSLTDEHLLISWAEPWYAPYGTHLNGSTRLPWLNLWFSERTVLNVRNLYPDGNDGAKRFEDVRCGLNKMTVARFEKLIAGVPGMWVEHLRLHSVKKVPAGNEDPGDPRIDDRRDHHHFEAREGLA